MSKIRADIQEAQALFDQLHRKLNNDGVETVTIPMKNTGKRIDLIVTVSLRVRRSSIRVKERLKNDLFLNVKIQISSSLLMVVNNCYLLFHKYEETNWIRFVLLGFIQDI